MPGKAAEKEYKGKKVIPATFHSGGKVIVGARYKDGGDAIEDENGAPIRWADLPES